MKIFLVTLLLQVVNASVYDFNEVITGNRSEKNPDYFKAFQIASQLVASSSMGQIIIITDNRTLSDHTHELIANITETTSLSLVFATVPTYIHATKLIMENLLQRQNIEVIWKNLNFLVIATSGCIAKVIQSVHQLDAEAGRGCLLRHFSRWIFIPTDDDFELIPTSDIVFDHINVITKIPSFLNGSGIEEEITVMSLFWESHGREWKVNRDFITMRHPSFPNIRHGLNGRTLVIASREWLPFSKRKLVDGEIIFAGVCGEMLNRLAGVFNFSIRYVEPYDNQWGEEINSTWTGIVGMLQRQEVDMCGVPYAMSTGRNKVMTYSYPFVYKYQSAVYRKSEDEKRSLTVLTSCFKWEVYICGLITVFGVSLLFLFFEKADPVRSHPLSPSEIAMLGVMVPLHQGNTATPASTPSRILLSFWWMFCIVVTSVYTGNLIAFLTVSKEYIPFRSMEEVANQQEYEVGTSSGEYIEHTLKTSNDSLFQSLWGMVKQSKMPQQVFGQDEWRYHMNKLDGGRYVFLLDETSIDVLMTERCDISKLPEDFMPIYSSFTFPKLSPLSSLFADELMYLTENGLVSTWYKMSSKKAKLCLEKSQREKLQLTSKDLISGFVACGVGIFLAGISLIGEVTLRRLYRVYYIKTRPVESRCSSLP